MLNYLLLGAVGLIVGLINGMAGGASILVYSLLSALGLNPVAAATTTALGVTPANFAATRHHEGSVRKLLRANRDLIVVSTLGTIIGAYFLLTMPMQTLQKISPFLVLIASLTFLVPTAAQKFTLSRGKEIWAIFGTGLYCGYFGPGQGVMVTATLARNPRTSTALLNATKNIVVGCTAITSDLIYCFSGHVNWKYAGVLAFFSAIGGHFGGKAVSKISPKFYRHLIMSVGFASTLWLFGKYY